MATRIKEKYLAEAVPALQQKFGYKNVMEIPKLEKIVINMGLGDCKDNAKALEMAVNELTAIAGQKPMVTKAKKSIANFKLREGMNIGVKVTLRGERMYEFMDRLFNQGHSSFQFIVSAMGHVKPRHIHPCVNHLQQRFFVVTSGTDRTDNFGFSHMFSLFYLITIYQTIPVWIIHVKYVLRKQIKEFLTENFLLLLLEQLTPNR